MKKKRIFTTLLVIICIIIFFIYTPFSEDKFYRAIPANTTLFCEQYNIGSQLEDILDSYPIKYFVEPYINHSEIKTYRENKSIMWLVNKILSRKTAIGISKHTGRRGEECAFAILEVKSLQQIAKLVLMFYKDKNLVKSKIGKNQSVWTSMIDRDSQINFTFSDGMLLLTISESKSSIEAIVQQLSYSNENSHPKKTIEQMKGLPGTTRGFYFPQDQHTKISKSILFSCKEFSKEQTHVNIYPNDDMANIHQISAQDINNMLETLNYYPTCFAAGTPKFFTTICEPYVNIPNNIKTTISNIENEAAFIASSSQKYSAKILKLKTPSIMLGTQISEIQKEQLIANIIKNFSTPKNQIFLTKEANNSNINIFTTSNEKNRYTQQPNTDKISFTSKNQLTIFASAYSTLNKIISKPRHNLYRDIDIPHEAIAFAVLDIPKTISLIEEYLDVYAIYLIVSSDKQTNAKRSKMNNQIKPILDKIKILGTITISVNHSVITPYYIEIKIINK